MTSGQLCNCGFCTFGKHGTLRVDSLEKRSDSMGVGDSVVHLQICTTPSICPILYATAIHCSNSTAEDILENIESLR